MFFVRNDIMYLERKGDEEEYPSQCCKDRDVSVLFLLSGDGMSFFGFSK